MFLFYSSHCKHCSMLLETLNTLDKKKIIKLISIDYIKSNNLNIDNRITHVPAMFLKDLNKVLLGKDVFDYLFLPGKGVLLKSNNDNITNDNINTDEPLGVNSFISQSYENIDDNDNYLTGPVTICEQLDKPNNPINIENKITGNDDTIKSHKELPNMSEILKQRDNDLN